MKLINWQKIARFAVQRLAAQAQKDSDRFYALRELGSILRPDYRFKWPDMDWWEDDEFNAYLLRFGELDGMNTDRRWMLHQLLQLAVNVPGDTAECGVYQGASSFLICQANEQSLLSKQHHCFDSYEGLSAPTKHDGDHWSAGDLTCGLELVKSNLSEFKSVEFHKGWIPERFTDVSDRRFSFVHVDVDLYDPTFDSVQFFYARMNPGAVFLCDDYGIASCPGATRAIDEFLSDKPEVVVRLSAGAGMFVKS